MKVIILTLCVFITLINFANAGEIYNCIDRDGNTVFTTNPQDGMKCELKESSTNSYSEMPTFDCFKEYNNNVKNMDKNCYVAVVNKMPLKLSKDCKYLYDTDQRTKLEANCKQEMNFAEQEMFSELEKCYKKPTRTECKGQMNTFYRSARSKPNNCTKALERIVKICGANLSANEQCYKDHWSEFETTCNLKTIQDDKYDTGMTNKIIKKNKSNIHNNKYNNVSTDKNNQLIEAVKKGSLSDVQAALANGADVNAKDNQEGATALKYASLENRTDIAKLLLDRGADINAKDKYGATALMSASIGNSRREVLKLLLDRGADVNAKDNKGYTALNHAKNMFWMETVKTLEKAGAKE